MREAAPYRPPPEPGRWRALTLAALMHLALFGLLWFGVRWQNETPVAVEAEVWTPRPIEAAPPPQVAPQPVPQPEPPRSAPEPPMPRAEVKPAPEAPRAPDPDIVLEQEKKKRKLEEEKRRAEEELRAERERKDKERAEQERKEKERERKLAQEKLEKEKEAARKNEAEELAKKEEQEKAKKAAEAKRKEELARAKAAEDKRRQEEAEAKAAEARHQKDLERLRSQAVGAGGAGEAPKAAGSRADASYLARVGAKIKSNTTYNVPDSLAGNPAVEYAVELLPDGSVRSVRKLKASGLDGFDEAVRRAIERSQPYPADKTGSVPPSFTVSHKPKDQ